MTDTHASPVDCNAKHLVLDYTCEWVEEGITPADAPPAKRRTRYRVYLLPPKAVFQGFGGSSSGLLVSKTPSLIVRESSGWGTRDTEYDITDPAAWASIRSGIAYALTSDAGNTLKIGPLLKV